MNQYFLSASSIDGAAVSAPSIFFQIVLTLSLLGIGLYAVALRRRIAALGNTAAMVTMAAMVPLPTSDVRDARMF